METKNIIKFDPTVKELKNIVKKTKKIKATDLEDKKQIEVVRATRIELKNARVKIRKAGKGKREEANEYISKVLLRENELIGIISPEEDRLKEIEAEAKDLAVKKERAEKLPERKARLAEIGDLVNDKDEHLLSLNAEEFESYYNKRVALKNQTDKEDLEEKERLAKEARDKEDQEKQAEIDAKKAEMDARQAELDKKEEDLKNEEKAREREEQAREDERKRLEQEAKDKEDIEAKAKADAEKEALVEKEKLEKREEYRIFRESNGWTSETKDDFKEQPFGDTIVLWKKLGVFKTK